MKVLFVAEYFPPVAPGGAEWSLFYLMSSLRREGVEVALATVNHGPAPEPIPGVKIFPMPFPLRLRAGQAMHRQGVFENPVFHWFFSRHVRRVLRDFEPDIVHAQSKNSLPAALWAARKAKKPIVYTLRDIGLACPFGMCFVQGNGRCDDFSWRKLLGSCSAFLVAHYTSGTLWQKVKVRVLAFFLLPDTLKKQKCARQVDILISPSRGLLDAYDGRVLPPAAQCVVVPHLPPPDAVPIDPTPWMPPALLGGKRFVLTAGKMSLGKGTPVLLEAIDRVHPRHPEVEFLLVGKGLRSLAVPGWVHILDSVPHPVLLSLLARAEIVAVPSLVPEAFNRVVLEAMSAGKPVIGTFRGSLPEQIENGVTGRLVEPSDASALAGALDELLSNPTRAKAMGEAGGQRVKSQWSPQRINGSLMAVYRSLLGPEQGIIDGHGEEQTPGEAVHA